MSLSRAVQMSTEHIIHHEGFERGRDVRGGKKEGAKGGGNRGGRD